MFKKIENIDTAFRQMRGLSFFHLCCTTIICCFTIYKCFELQSKIYVLVNGKAVEALKSNEKDNIDVEARDHIKTFHQYFFTLDPDDKAIRENITKALYLADGSAKRMYDNLSENKFYSSLIAGNINQTITIDSVKIDLDKDPYQWRCYSTQHIIRPTTITQRILVTEGALRSISKRTDNNPHGFLIERLNTMENRDISTENRH